jgi:zinc transporter
MTITHGPVEGYLWAYRFHDGAPSPLAAAGLPTDLTAGCNWAWGHFALSDPRGRAYLSALEAAPEAARATLLGDDDAPRVLASGLWTYGVLPDFEIEFDGRATGLGRLRFAFDGKLLITARRHAVLVAQDLRRRLQANDARLDTPLAAFRGLCMRYCEVAEDQLDAPADRIDQVEDRVLGYAGGLDQTGIGPLRHDLSRRRRDAALLRTAYVRATARHGAALNPNVAALLPMLVQKAEDLDHEIAALQDRARLIHEEIGTMITTATNRTLHALTVMTALMAPPTIIVGAFGMNLKGILFGDSPMGFAVVCALCAGAILGAYLGLRALKLVR